MLFLLSLPLPDVFFNVSTSEYNANEVIKTILDFFIQNIYKHKAQNANKRTWIKNALKNIWGEKVTYSLICVFVVFCFAWLRFCALGAFCAKTFCKKEFKTALMNASILLLSLSSYKHEFFKSQSFSIITIFFQLSQSFSIITIFFNFFFFITTCDTIFMKISQRTNSII